MLILLSNCLRGLFFSRMERLYYPTERRFIHLLDFTLLTFVARSIRKKRDWSRDANTPIRLRE